MDAATTEFHRQPHEPARGAILGAIPDSIFRMRGDGTYLDFSAPPGARLLAPPEQFLGRRADEVLEPAHAAQCLGAIRLALRDRRSTMYEYSAGAGADSRHYEVRVAVSGPDEVVTIVRDITDRKRAEAEQRRSQQKLALHFQQTAVGVVEWTLDLRVAEWNAGAERIFGFKKEAVLGRPMFEFLVPTGEARGVQDAADGLLRGTSGSIRTNENLTADGRTIVCEWHNTALIDENGVVVGFASLVGDVTDRVRAEEALRASRETYEALVNTVDGIVWERDPRTLGFTIVSKQAERILGYPVARWLASPDFWVEHVHPDDRGRVVPFCIMEAGTGIDHQFEYRMIRADGETVWLRDYVTAVHENGRAARLRGVMVDITERKRAEEAVRQSESRFRRVVDSNMIGVCFWDIHGAIGEANDLFLSIIGKSRADLQGGALRLRDITPAEAAPPVERALLSMSGSGVCRPFATEFVKGDGSRVPVVMGAAFLEGSRDKGVSFVLDMTERKRAEERQAFMMAELDHRVKNNLAAVLTLAEQSIKPAQSVADFCETLMGRLRALARMHNSLAQTHWHGAHLLPLVQQTMEAFRQGASTAVSLTGEDVVLPPRTASALAMALHELATNALKYGALSSPEGRVAVAWSEVSESGRPMLRLTWTESGGPAVAPPTRRGFGRELIEGGVAHEALGRVSLGFPPSGVVCEMIVSLERDEQHGPDRAGRSPGPPDNEAPGEP